MADPTDTVVITSIDDEDIVLNVFEAQIAIYESGVTAPGLHTHPEIVTTGDKNFVHSQLVPAAEWVVQHNLGKIPSVGTFDSANTRIEGDIFIVDNNQIIVSFSDVIGGKAICN